MNKDNIYLFANLLFEQENYNKAIEEYEKLLQCENTNIFFINTMLATCYRETGEALKSYESALKCKEMQPKHELSSLNLYLALVDLKRYEEAIEELYNFANNNPINMYRDTIWELFEDMKVGNALFYKEKIVYLAKKHSLSMNEFHKTLFICPPKYSFQHTSFSSPSNPTPKPSQRSANW